MDLLFGLRDAGIPFRVPTRADMPERLAGDEMRFGQVALNLLSNAVKFTSTGVIHLSVALLDGTQAEGGERMVRFAVRDTGVGITPDRMGRLFQAFAQADSSITRLYGGTGLGLSMVYGVARQSGGTARITSTWRMVSWLMIPSPAVAG